MSVHYNNIYFACCDWASTVIEEYEHILCTVLMNVFLLWFVLSSFRNYGALLIMETFIWNDVANGNVYFY